MKTVLMLALLLVATSVSAQLTVPLPGTVQHFEPLSVRGQKRPLTIPVPPTPLAKNARYWGIWFFLIIGLFFLARLVFTHAGSNVVRAAVVIVAVLAGLGVSFILVLMRAYDFDSTAPSLENVAAIEFYNMTQTMGAETPYHQVIADDDFRIGVGAGAEQLIIADYQTNKGLIFNLADVDTLLSHIGARAALPPLPESSAAVWAIETDGARQAGDAVLQQAEYILKGVLPNRVIIRFVHAGYPHSDVSAMQEVLQNAIQYNKENPQ